MDINQALESYRINLYNACVFGVNDIRGVQSINNVRLLLRDVLNPYDPDVLAIENQVFGAIGNAMLSAVSMPPKIQYHPRQR